MNFHSLLPSQTTYNNACSTYFACNDNNYSTLFVSPSNTCPLHQKQKQQKRQECKTLSLRFSTELKEGVKKHILAGASKDRKNIRANWQSMLPVVENWSFAMYRTEYKLTYWMVVEPLGSMYSMIQTSSTLKPSTSRYWKEVTNVKPPFPSGQHKCVAYSECFRWVQGNEAILHEWARPKTLH